MKVISDIGFRVELSEFIASVMTIMASFLEELPSARLEAKCTVPLHPHMNSLELVLWALGTEAGWPEH